MLALDIPNLQQETIDLLESSKVFLSKINHTENCQQQITQQQELVKKLELRMTVVAPMKAGKSTIINAIVGQELVPSHSFAMTTLPTEIVINNQLTEPKLQIPNQTVEILTGLTQQITQAIEQQGIEWAYKQTEEYLHLKDLVTELAQGMSINSQVIGHSDIQNYLEKVNHIIRLATKLIPNYDWNIFHLPRIETPCQSSIFSSLQQSNLIIVDTPGPNEAGDNHKLAETVITQIQNSSVVLFILDYTNLHTKAEEEVKKEVQKIIDLRGKDNLFVLVNKIDRRKDKNSLNSEQVKSYVKSEFGIENIFEISAINAFNANSFLQNKNNPQELFEDIDTWEMVQDTITETKLQQLAKQKWQKSGFSSFLKDVIYKLTIGSTHECMRTAIKTARSCLN
ncbi:dynamin family protein [Thiotrichales bacterium HSG1]|nr:dynamin family protein [Thiotrichales bacterium HSG1]